MQEDQNPPQGPPREPPEPPIPPIPPVASGAGRCPGCGSELMPGSPYCLHCGARLSTAQPGVPGVLGIIGLSLAALGLGSFGACSVLVGPTMGLNSGGLLFLALGAGALYLAFLCVRRIGDLLRARRDRP